MPIWCLRSDLRVKATPYHALIQCQHFAGRFREWLTERLYQNFNLREPITQEVIVLGTAWEKQWKTKAGNNLNKQQLDSIDLELHYGRILSLAYNRFAYDCGAYTPSEVITTCGAEWENLAASFYRTLVHKGIQELGNMDEKSTYSDETIHDVRPDNINQNIVPSTTKSS